MSGVLTFIGDIRKQFYIFLLQMTLENSFLYLYNKSFANSEAFIVSMFSKTVYIGLFFPVLGRMALNVCMPLPTVAIFVPLLSTISASHPTGISTVSPRSL